MFSDQEWTELVHKLLRATATDRVEWRLEGGSVVTDISGYDYAIGSVDGDGRPPYFLSIGDPEERREVARLESEPLSEDVWQQELSGAQLIPELRERAIRNASGSPQLFRRLMDGLNQIDPDFTPF